MGRRRKGQLRKAAMCSSKRRYRDEISAMLALSRRNASVFRAYRCPYCAGWHLTSETRAGGAVQVRHSDGQADG